MSSPKFSENQLQVKHAFHSMMSKCIATVLILFVGWCVCSCSTITQVPTLTPEEIEQEVQVQARHFEKRLIAGTQRVADASWPLITKNLALCEEYTDFQIGVWIARRVRKNVTTDAIAWGVAPDSPAALAGLQVQDLIFAIDDNVVKNGLEARAELKKVLKQFSEEGRTEPIELMVARSNFTETSRSSTFLSFSIQPVETCRSEIFVTGSLNFSAYATGNRIGVSTGLLNFIETEPELQYILAHELAHNFFGHISKARTRTILGGVLDGISLVAGIWTNGLFAKRGFITHSKRFEKEADYVSMYILANAGVDLNGIEDVWRQVTTQSGALGASKTHPSNPVRYLRMSKTRQEIADKVEHGQPLIPELKRDTKE